MNDGGFGGTGTVHPIFRLPYEPRPTPNGQQAPLWLTV
jgi:hypothetical protein